MFTPKINDMFEYSNCEIYKNINTFKQKSNTLI